MMTQENIKVSGVLYSEIKHLRDEHVLCSDIPAVISDITFEKYPNMYDYIYGNTTYNKDADNLSNVLKHALGYERFEVVEPAYVARVDTLYYYTEACTDMLRTFGIRNPLFTKENKLTNTDIKFLQDKYGVEKVELIEVY